MNLPALPTNPALALMSRAHALKAAVDFIRAMGQTPPIVIGSGRPFVLDIMTREWIVVFEEEANVYFALTAGALQPRYRRVAVHAETGACRWVDEA